MNLKSVAIKAFVPAFDFDESKAFYETLGFGMPWSSEGLAHFRHGHCSFLLQAYYVREHAENFMMQMVVENVDDWHAHVRGSGVEARFGIKVGDPSDQPWGMRDFTIFDPSGVLWRIAQDTPDA